MNTITGFKLFCRVLFYTAIVCLSFAVGSGTAQEIPEAIVSLPEGENAIIVEKKTQTLYVFSNRNNNISMGFKSDCSTGEVAGVKQKAGDKKTPVGIYFLVDEYEDRYLTPIYGKKAFPTDYPNLVDKRSGKNGSAIWIHGTNKALKPMDSNGCVAMENSDILALADLITLDSTPVIMVETYTTADKTELEQTNHEVRGLVDQWLMALQSKSYHRYLSFYAETYLPDIQWWEEWVGVRTTAFKLDPEFRIVAERTGIYQHDGLLVVLFDSFFTLNEEKIYLGKRKLFLKRFGNEYKIIGDTFQRLDEAVRNASAPLVTAVRKKVTPELESRQVMNTVRQWLSAWVAKDMDRYASHYARSFRSDGLNKRTWVKRKRSLARKYNYINVSGKNFQVTVDGRRAEVIFFQDYESSGFTTQGTKTLKLVNEGGLWKIYQESWQEK